ncbi:MAG: hypothetical protein VX777_06140 [Chlamydiota bacterium]|nr:hypothetical protein [Chlamydiota bacterium]
MINELNNCKLAFFSSINQHYDKYKNIPINVISSNFNECFKNFSPSTKVSNDLTIELFNKRVREIHLHYWYDLGGTFTAFDDNLPQKFTVNKNFMLESGKLIIKQLPESQNSYILSKLLKDLSKSISSLNLQKKIVTLLNDFESSVLKSVKRLVFDYLIPYYNRDSIDNFYRSLKVNDVVFSRMQKYMDYLNFQKICEYPEVFRIDTPEKISSIIKKQREALDRDKSIKLFRNVVDITADEILEIWNLTSQFFDIIAVLEDKEFLDAGNTKAIIDKYFGLSERIRTQVFFGSLWVALEKLSLNCQYNIIKSLILRKEAKLIPKAFWAQHDHEQSELKNIANMIFDSWHYHLEQILPSMKIKDENFLVDLLTKMAKKRCDIAKSFHKYNITNIKNRETIALEWAKQPHNFDMQYLQNFNLDPSSHIYTKVLTQLAETSFSDFTYNCGFMDISKDIIKEVIFKISKKHTIFSGIALIDSVLTDDERVLLFTNNLEFSILESISGLKELKINDKKMVENLIALALHRWSDQKNNNCYDFFIKLSMNIIEGVDYYQFFQFIISNWKISDVIKSLDDRFPSSCIKQVLLDLIEKIKVDSINTSIDHSELNLLLLTNNCPEVLEEILPKAAGLKIFNVSHAMKAVSLDENARLQIAKKEVEECPDSFLSYIENYKFKSKDLEFSLIKSALEKVKSLYSFSPPELQSDMRREKIYRLARKKVDGGNLDLDLLCSFKFDDESLRYKYAIRTVKHSKFVCKYGFEIVLEKLKLKPEHLYEVLKICTPKFDTFLFGSDEQLRIDLFNQLNTAQKKLLLREIVQFFDEPLESPYEISLLNIDDLLTLIDLSLSKENVSFRKFFSIVTEENIALLYPYLLKIFHQHPGSVEELEFNMLSPQQIKEVVQKVYSSLMRKAYISNTSRILEIATLYFEKNQLQNITLKFMYDHLINPFGIYGKLSVESKLQTDESLMKLKFVQDYFSRKQIHNDFQREYAFETCMTLLPESLHHELQNIHSFTAYLPLKEKLVCFLLEIANHYYFNNLFQRDYKKNIYIKKVVHQIIKIRSPYIKDRLITIFFNKFFRREQLACDRLMFFKKLSEDKKIKDKAALATLLLCSEFPTIEKNVIINVAYAISANKSLVNDRVNFTRFMEKFAELLDSNKIENSKVLSIVLNTVQTRSGKQVAQDLSLINAIIMLEGSKSIDNHGKFDIQNRLYITNIKERLEIDEYSDEEFILLFKKHFERYSDKFAIIKYIASQVNNHSEYSSDSEYYDSDSESSDDKEKVRENSAVLPFLKMHMLDIFNGDYTQQRYSLEKSAHLKKIFQKHPHKYSVWKENLVIDALKLLPSEDLEIQNKEINYFEQFRLWIIKDKHIPEKDMESKFPLLNTILLNETLPDLRIVEEVIERLETSLVKSVDKQSVQLQIKALQLMISDQPTLPQLKSLCEDISFSYEFKRNISKLIEIKQLKNHVDLSNCIAEITDDPESLLMMGSDCGTCQRVDGDSEYNQGLIGVFNGKYKLVTIREKDSNKVYGRCLLKVLIDKKTEQGVLFMERIYTNVSDPRVAKGIKKLCIAQAEKMQMPLLKCRSRGVKYPNSVLSENDRFNIEYVDALGGVRVGRYTIKNSVYVRL